MQCNIPGVKPKSNPCTPSGTEGYGIACHHHPWNAFPWNCSSASQPLCLGLLHEEAHVPTRWARGAGWRPQTVTLLNWGSPWQQWKNSSVWQTVDRVCLGLRAITDLSTVIYEVVFTNGVLEVMSHHLNRDEILLQILPEMRDERHLPLSLPGPCHSTLSSRPLSLCQVRLKVSRWSGSVWGGEITCINPVLRKSSLK